MQNIGENSTSRQGHDIMKAGDKAPDFELSDTNGRKIKLSDFKGKKVVLYFYPKDMTIGCTIEACSFRDNYSKFKKAGIEILGVSADDGNSHQKFTDKYKLPFTLLSDEDGKICKKYRVWKEKSFLGKKFMGIERTTFVIDEKGKIEKIFPKVKVDGHWKEILDSV